jgi:hypothetical protein
MSKILTLEQFKDYLLIRCGYPVINVEVSRDEPTDQLGQVIEDTIQFYQTYNLNEGSNFEYYLLTISAGIDTYTMPEDIQEVVDIDLSLGMEGINVLFSPQHTLLYTQFVAKGSILGASNPDYSPGMVLTTYDSAMLFLKEIKQHFGRGYTVKYNRNTNILKIVPTPYDTGVGVLSLYKKDEATNLYNNPLVKNLAYAKTLMIWGSSLSKYIVSMPDGISMNGQDIYNKGKELSDKTEQEIKDQSPPPDFFIA